MQTAAMNLNASCGCPACDAGVQPGHFACDQADAAMVELEKRGRVVRYYDGTAWRWEAVADRVAIEFDRETRDWAVLEDGQIAGFYASRQAAEDAANALRTRRAHQAAQAEDDRPWDAEAEEEILGGPWTLELEDAINVVAWREMCAADGYTRHRDVPAIDAEIVARGRCECGSALLAEARAKDGGRNWRLFAFCPACRLGHEM